LSADEQGLRNRVRDERVARSLTQEALARLVGVSRKTVNTIETGRYVPSTILALRLARALGRRVEELFYIEE
jgi:putative transcriptional regulator